MKLKAVLFDLDETLLPVERVYRRGVRAAWREFRRERRVSGDRFCKLYCAARRTVKSRLGAAPTARSRLLYFKELVEAAAGRPRPAQALALMRAYDGAWSALETGAGRRTARRLAGRYALGVVTNQVCTMQLLKMSRLDPRGRLFAARVTSEEVGVEKPDPRIYREACRRLGCRPAEALMVGDSWKDDILGARIDREFGS
ncbi:MAG: HAD family hydrolase [Elusimicrobiota bacterium]